MPKRRHFPLSNARSCSQTVYIPWCIHPSGDTRLGIVGAYQTRWSMSQTCTRCSLRHLQIATGLKGSYLYTVEMSIFQSVHGLNTSVVGHQTFIMYVRVSASEPICMSSVSTYNMQVVGLHVRGAAIRLPPAMMGVTVGGKGVGAGWRLYGEGKCWHDQPFVGRAGLINHAQAFGVGLKYGLLP